MKCNSCNNKIPSECLAAIVKNMCPFCGGNILPADNKATYDFLRKKLKKLPLKLDKNQVELLAVLLLSAFDLKEKEEAVNEEPNQLVDFIEDEKELIDYKKERVAKRSIANNLTKEEVIARQMARSVKNPKVVAQLEEIANIQKQERLTDEHYAGDDRDSITDDDYALYKEYGGSDEAEGRALLEQITNKVNKRNISNINRRNGNRQ